jgi:hypothetical protein
MLRPRFHDEEKQRLLSTQEATGATQIRILKGLIIAAIREGRIKTEYSRRLEKTTTDHFVIALPKKLEKDWRDLCKRENISPNQGVRHLIWSAVIKDGILEGYR